MNTLLFWNRVKILIRAHKLNQRQFARHIGVNPSTFCGWIYNNRIPDIETALQMAAALGVGLEYLVFGADAASSEAHARQTEERKKAAMRI